VSSPLPSRDYSALTPAELWEWHQLLESRFGGESLADFICRVAPHEPPPRHLMPVLDALERAKTIGGQRVCLSMPPRHAKSTTIRRAIGWWLLRCPADPCAYVSRTCDGAEAQSRKVRTLAQQIGIPLMRGSQRDDRWETAYGGGLIATGIDGMLTGNPIKGLGIVDDPIKSRAEANSEAYRERVWDFFNDVLMTRLEGPASVFVIHTRWDPDDLIGRLIEEQGWDVINLSAIAEADDPIGRMPGEALWPDRFPVERLLKIKQRNEFTFESLYQGKPTPKGARLFYGPARYYDPKKTDLTGCHVLIGGDPAATAKTTADFSAYVALAVRPPFHCPTVYVLDVYRRQVEVPQQARDALEFQRRNYGAMMWVESVGGFKAVPQLIRDLAPGVLIGEITPRGDKRQRAERIASAWNDGRVLLPKTDPHLPGSDMAPPWLAEYVDEVQRFTGRTGGQDDQVDASANAFNEVVELKNEVQVHRGAVRDPARWG
jgi:predicted phage terminase large subunit-like protein